MKRFAVFALAGLCVLVLTARGQTQGLKERSLSDAPTDPAPAPPARVTPAQPPTQPTQPAQRAAQQPAAAHPGASVQPAVPQQPGAQPVPQQPAARPAVPVAQPPVQQPAFQPQQPVSPPPPPAGSTPINGSTTVSPPPPPPPPPPRPSDTYTRNEVNREVMGFFESGSRGLAEVVARAFRDNGQPTGFIKGNEAGGALIVGLRYGSGTLYLKGQPPVQVYWQSPSVGFDLGVNAVKVFTLVYGMHTPDAIFQRFPGVDGSIYLIGGFGVNYQRSGPYTLAPIRFGVGLRLGANLGYQHYTRTQSINPF